MLVGFNRCLSVTMPAFEDKVLQPLRDAGCDVSVDIIVSRSRRRVVNPRSGESAAAEWDLPPSARRYRTRTHSATLLDLRVWRRFRAARRVGDPWPDSNFKNLRNQVAVLKLQHMASRRIDDGVDLVLFVRPDLMPLDVFDIGRYIDIAADAVVVPYWHPFGGHNDRVALMPPQLAHRYLGRWQLIPYYLSTGRVLHAERFLRFTLRKHPVEPVMVERFNRMRVGGVELHEDFLAFLPARKWQAVGIIPGTNGDFPPR
jgi:hypothetical protein